MKALTLPVTVSLLLLSGFAGACGTRPPAVQAEIDARELAELRKLAHAAAQQAEEIYVGTVTHLTRPTWGTDEMGSVTFTINQTFKGEPAPTRTAQWQGAFVYSPCDPSAMFHNVGFRPGGVFIVYVRGGKVFRSDAADHLRSGLLSLEEERAIAAGSGSS
ncbi:hypothetical protein [Lysobacter sp. N42]|uniref:hypothetical protein n=1 Tax=Lysobacter sp. N42 TaxID=2545719 RepID=UPI0010537FD4|nr:hypothetical protein [Lysobacter sp. N42]TCZ78323.1 hypothetical protein EYQ95_25750 [Lysobacter sp. N42]